MSSAVWPGEMVLNTTQREDLEFTLSAAWYALRRHMDGLPMSGTEDIVDGLRRWTGLVAIGKPYCPERFDHIQCVLPEGHTIPHSFDPRLGDFR